MDNSLKSTIICFIMKKAYIFINCFILVVLCDKNCKYADFYQIKDYYFLVMSEIDVNTGSDWEFYWIPHICT